MNSDIMPAMNAEEADPVAGKENPGSESLAAIAIYLSRKTDADLPSLLGELERRIIIETLRSTKGNQLVASRRLGVKYTTLNDKIKRHRIDLRKRIFVEGS